MTFRDNRSFLFLQGPPGPFYAQLAAALRKGGHRCCRVNFNGGDWANWRGRAMNFRGSIDDWPQLLGEVLARERVTDLILFGDCRPLHVTARALAEQRGIVAHVFEEGYIRPDWVTLERGGVNGHSRLPRDSREYLRLAEGLPPVARFAPIPASFRVRATEAAIYYFATWALSPVFAGYRSHRPHGSLAEMLGWAGRWLCRPAARLRSFRAMAKLGERPYFVLPLQLDSDHQIRIHSPFDGMAEAIGAIVASFAAHAPQDATLVVKEHPLDNGLTAWRAIVRAAAARHRVAARILFIEHGDIEALVMNARGVVTVNSTTGTLALAAGRPVAVLGTAVYDLPGVTHQGSLDGFWTSPDAPQLEIYEAFRRVLVSRCLLRGGFSSGAGRARLVPEAAARLTSPRATDIASAPGLFVRVPA